MSSATSVQRVSMYDMRPPMNILCSRPERGMHLPAETLSTL